MSNNVMTTSSNNTPSDASKARHVVYSQNCTPHMPADINPFQEHVNMFAGAQSTSSHSDSSSQFSDEFLNNDGYLTSSNDSSFDTSSVKSSRDGDA